MKPEIFALRPPSLLSLLLCAGCAGSSAGAPPSESTATSSAPAPDTLAGTLRQVGSAPVSARLVIQGAGESVTVLGALSDELRRLTGAEVVLVGKREGSGFVPARYHIRTVDGRPVATGTVEAISGDYARLRTEEGEAIYLAGAPDQFQVGQKLWVQGPRALIVQSHGVLRP